MESSMEIAQKLKKTFQLIQSYHSWAYIWRNLSQETTEPLAHPCLLCIIHSSQVMETAQMANSWWVGQGNVVCVHAGTLLLFFLDYVLWCGISGHLFNFFFPLLAVLGFELRALHLLGRCTTAWVTPPANTFFLSRSRILTQGLTLAR
jgi:hypothetical protein